MSGQLVSAKRLKDQEARLAQSPVVPRQAVSAIAAILVTEEAIKKARKVRSRATIAARSAMRRLHELLGQDTEPEVPDLSGHPFVLVSGGIVFPLHPSHRMMSDTSKWALLEVYNVLSECRVSADKRPSIMRAVFPSYSTSKSAYASYMRAKRKVEPVKLDELVPAVRDANTRMWTQAASVLRQRGPEMLPNRSNDSAESAG